MKKIFRLLFLFCTSILLTGCSTLTYVGEDYVPSNTQTVKTNEDFVFDVYKKSIGDTAVKIGISKTQIVEILALYVQIENYSYDTPYVFRVEDLRVSTKNETLPFIRSENYLSIWQSQEAASMAQMSSLGATLTTMTAGMMTNYEEYNQGIVQNNAQQSSNSEYSRMKLTGDKILKHTTKTSSTISPRKSQYFYFFIEDKDEDLTVRYKNLEYRFKV